MLCYYNKKKMLIQYVKTMYWAKLWSKLGKDNNNICKIINHLDVILESNKLC